MTSIFQRKCLIKKKKSGSKKVMLDRYTVKHVVKLAHSVLINISAEQNEHLLSGIPENASLFINIRQATAKHINYSQLVPREAGSRLDHNSLSLYNSRVNWISLFLSELVFFFSYLTIKKMSKIFSPGSGPKKIC